MLSPVGEGRSPSVDVQRARPLATISAVIKAKKLTWNCSEGLPKAQGDASARDKKVTILERKGPAGSW